MATPLASGLFQKEIRGVNSFTRRRQSGEELEWQTQLLRLVPELIAIGAVPGHDGIERAQPFDQRARRVDARQAPSGRDPWRQSAAPNRRSELNGTMSDGTQTSV